MMITANGGQLHCARTGSGPPVVLLHGIQGTSAAWASVSSELTHHHTVIAPDLRGRAPSLIPTEPDSYTLELFADDFGRVLNMLDEPAIIVAWSMGGLVLLERIRRHGISDISGAVLTGTTAFPGSDAQWFKSSTVESLADEATNRAQALNLDPVADSHAVAATWWHARHADYRDVLRTITIPIIVAHGTLDNECPLAHGEFLAQHLPNARLETWPDAGHNLMSHDSSRFARMIRDFAQSIGGSV